MSFLVPMVSPLSRANIEQMAINVLENFSPGLLQKPGAFPALEFFNHYLPERYCLDTGVEDLGDGIEGLTFPDGRVLVSTGTYTLADQENGRARFTIVHEGFHGIQHKDQIRNSLVHTSFVLHRRQNIPAYRDGNRRAKGTHIGAEKGPTWKGEIVPGGGGGWCRNGRRA